MSDAAISAMVASGGVSLASTKAFLRDCGTSVSLDIRTKFDAWVEDERAAGRDIDEELVEAVRHDLDVHHRLTPETLIGAPHAPFASLNHTEDQHFGR